MDIGGDVVGRDNVKSHVTNTYNYGPLPPQSRRAELPHQPYFFGREDELKIIADALDPESNGWGVLIDGPGGIGKTALAIRAGHLAADQVYPTKIFLSAKIRELTPQGEQKLQDFMLPNYMALLAELARELGDEGIERIDAAARPKEVRRLLENSHALILIDNLETFDERERDRLFQFLRRLPRSCKAIVTSRRRTDVAAEIIRLDRLKKDDALKLIAKLADRNRFLARASDQECQDLYEITKGNPLLMEWIAAQLGRRESRCRTIADACQYLESAPQDNDPLDYIFGDLLDTFTAHETAVLAALSHFTLPAKTRWIAEVAGLHEHAAQTALEDLVDRSLVISDIHTRQHVSPPLAAVFLRRSRPADMVQTGERLTDQVLALAIENGYRSYEHYPVLEAEWNAIAAALPLFLQGENSRLQRLCDALHRFLEFSGRWDEYLSISLQAEARAVAANDLNNAGWRADNAGRIYFLLGKAPEVLACADRAEKDWMASVFGAREKRVVPQLRGMGYRLAENYPAAMAAFQASLAIRRALEQEGKYVAIALNDLARVEHLSGDFVNAERDYREALRLAEKVNYREGGGRLHRSSRRISA